MLLMPLLRCVRTILDSIGSLLHGSHGELTAEALLLSGEEVQEAALRAAYLAHYWVRAWRRNQRAQGLRAAAMPVATRSVAACQRP